MDPYVSSNFLTGAAVDQALLNGNAAHTAVGDLTSLTTTDKSSVVAAINELASEVLGIDALVGTGVIS